MKNWMKYVCLIMACLLLGSGIDALAEDNKSQAEITNIMATGIGLDPDSAFKNALSNAVQQAVGTVVDAETLVKNEQIVKDQVLTYSDAFVTEVEKIKTVKRSDGLFESSIKASVQKRKLIEKLKENNISITSVDGTSLFAETLTQIKGQTDANALFEKSLEGLPIGLINPRIVDQKPQIIEKTSNGAKVSWKIEISYNQNDYYNKVMPSLQQTLEQISIDKSQSYISTQGSISDKVIYTRDAFFKYIMDFEKRYEKEKYEKKHYLVFLNVGRNMGGDNLRWNWYILERSIFEYTYKKFISIKYPLRIEYIDLNGNILRSEDLDLTSGDIYPKTKPQLYFDFPFFIILEYSDFVWLITPFFYGSHHGQDRYFDQFTLDFNVNLNMEEMKNLKEIKCSFIKEKKGE
jgi:hypothetical protein